jgi:hypothetical protein
MKWGVRRYQNPDGSLTPAGKKRYRDSWSDDAKTAHDIRKTKTVKQMTNAELRKLNERTQLENQYSQLRSQNITRGMAYVAAAATLMGTVANLYNNSNNLVNIGKKVAGHFIK